MGFVKADLIRLPILIIFDAFVASKFKGIWSFGSFFGLAITFAGISLSLFVFSCHHTVIIEIYRLLLAAVIHCAIHAWNFSVVLISHTDYYGQNDSSTKSLIFSLIKHVFQNSELSQSEIDFSVKALISVSVVNMLHVLLLATLGKNLKNNALWVFVTSSPLFALAFNIPRTFTMFLILMSNIPILMIFCQQIQMVRVRWTLMRHLNTNEPWTYSLDNIIGWVNNMWGICRVPSVLRLYFIFKCVWGLIIISSEREFFSNASHGGGRKSGLYYFFDTEPLQMSQEYIEWDTTGYFSVVDKQRNLTMYEGLAVILTDSLISSFAVGSAISVLGFYVGTGLHNFVGGNGIMQGEALGMMSSVLFCLLSIQTGLSSLPPVKRIIRLYRNSFLLGSAVMHFFLDVVHPVLMTISPQSHIPFKKHFRPLLICVILLILPTALCYWIITTKPISTWMVALTAFNIELIVKVISTLLVYALYVVDARSHTTGIVNLDEYVFWIRSVSHIIEFICGLVMFVNGAYILFFESSNLLRAIMMSMHAYVNIYRTFREGLKTFNNRRTVNKKIASLELVNVDELDTTDMDVCSICYQDFSADNGEARLTRCRHMFHSTCLRKWIFIQDSCPMCDRALFSNDENKEE